MISTGSSAGCTGVPESCATSVSTERLINFDCRSFDGRRSRQTHHTNRLLQRVPIFAITSKINNIYRRPCPSQILKRQLEAGKHKDFLILRNPCQSREHFDDPVVVRIDQRIIQDDRHVPSLARKKTRKGHPPGSARDGRARLRGSDQRVFLSANRRNG